MNLFKKTLPIAVAIMVGVYALLEFYIPRVWVNDTTSELRAWIAILSSAAYVLGAINIVQVTVPKIRRREPDWLYKVVMLGSMVLMLVTGLVGHLLKTGPAGTVEIADAVPEARAAGKAVVTFESPPDVMVAAGGGLPVPARDAQGQPLRLLLDPGGFDFKAYRRVSGYADFASDVKNDLTLRAGQVLWVKAAGDGSPGTVEIAAPDEAAGAAGKAVVYLAVPGATATVSGTTHELGADPVRVEIAAGPVRFDVQPDCLGPGEQKLTLRLGPGDAVRVKSDPPMMWGAKGRVFSWCYEHFYAPCNATMFALLAFYVASAAFRAFRARNVEAGLLLASAIIVMLGRAPLGAVISDSLPALTQWILDVPSNGSRRAIMMGAAIGAIATGLRVILGIERSYMGAE